jgi:hypothetical protein
MRKILFLLFLSVSVIMSAESITIKQKSGNKTILDLSTNPIITFSGENMVVTNDFTSIMLPLDDIDSYVVGNVNTGILEMADTPEYHDGHVMFKGIVEGTTVFVHSIDGKMIHKFTSDGSGILEVNIGIFPKGVYIITTTENQIKVINK